MACLPGLFGCPSAIPQSDEDGNVGVDPGMFPTKRVQGEPNDGFINALDVIYDSQNIAQLSGNIDSVGDIDVYLLGALQAGDRVIVDVGTPGSELDAAIGIFDAEEKIVFENDDRSYLVSQYDPFINNVIRHSSALYYLAIYRAPLDTSNRIGAYEIQVTIVPDGTVPPTAGQIVVLDFDGGSITLPGGESYQVGVFDTADISPSYRGMTAEVRNKIEATVNENFQGLDMSVRVTPRDALPGSDYSTILFGGTSSGSYGISQQIDPYNEDHDDKAIIFTGMFTPARFARTLTADELGLAIGNIAAHELGHLLGLNHVADVLDLMDTTGATNTFLFDQEFKTSVLDDTIAPLGLQDGWLLLLETLGISDSIPLI